MSSNKIVCNSGDPKLDAAVYEWLKIDKNEETMAGLHKDIEEKDWIKLRKSMLSRQKFGTAGLRGRMGAGFNCMNDVIVLQTAQGLLSYLKKQSCQDKLERGIVLGFDGRHNSKRFAALTARVFLCAGIPVLLYFETVPTPLVSFATKHLGAAAGVMVTASHNPKEDNGYKVYWSNGSQIISPHDDNLMEEILQNLEIPPEHWECNEVFTHKNVTNIYDTMLPEYMTFLKESLHGDVLEENKNNPIDIVYSAMHGTGYESIKMAFEACNLKAVKSVKQQEEPNGDFPTVQFPNPEEISTLKLSIEQATDAGVNLILANDPDADRLAVAEYDPSKKQWKIFSGNEMGALLGWWILQQHYKKYPDTDPEDVYMLASVVSSKMLRSIVKGKGQFVETLTGFKWMGNTALLLQQQGKIPLFAYEEAIGYMCNPVVPDKDGVSAAVYVASLATSLYAKGSSLKKQLQELYHTYGYHLTYNSWYYVDEQTVTQSIFRRIRNFDGPGLYPTKVGEEEIVFVHDLRTGVKLPESQEKMSHLNVIGTGLDRDYTSGEMVMFRTRSGLSVTVRTSGTEPKIKYYTELADQAAAQNDEEIKKMQIKVEAMVDAFIENLIDPKAHGLKRPDTKEETR